MTGADFRKASLATEGEEANIYFAYADLTGANFGEASLATEGDKSPFYFEGVNMTGANFKKAALATEGVGSVCRRVRHVVQRPDDGVSASLRLKATARRTDAALKPRDLSFLPAPRRRVCCAGDDALHPCAYCSVRRLKTARENLVARKIKR